jgi:hypothetical protein
MMVVVDGLTDFLLQMELATLEETPLYEIPLGSVDLATPPVTHGPWPAATCAAVLRLWHRAGWIGLHLPDWPAEWKLIPADWCSRLIDGDTLTRPDADELLDHPQRWLLGHADGHAAPYKTVAGETTPREQWHGEARDMAQRLFPGGVHRAAS